MFICKMTDSIRASSIENILVKDVMTKLVISVDSTVTSYNAAKKMEEAEIGAIVIIENSKPVGIITDRDFAVKITAHAYPIDTPVRRVMSSPLISITSNSTFRTAVDLMRSKKIRKLLVVDNDKVVGIISTTDLINHLANIS